MENQPETLAHHFKGAGVNDKAVNYYIKAGVNTLNSYSFSESKVHSESGLKLLKFLPECEKTQSFELSLLSNLFHSRFATNFFDFFSEKGPLLEMKRIAFLSEKLNDNPSLVTILNMLINLTVYNGDVDNDKYRKKMLSVSKFVEDSLKPIVYCSYATPLTYSGKFHEALKYYDLAESYIDNDNISFIGLVADIGVQIYTEVSSIHLFNGNFQESKDYLNLALKRLNVLNDKLMYSYFYLMSSIVHYFIGDYEKCDSNLNETSNIIETYGKNFYAEYAYTFKLKVDVELNKNLAQTKSLANKFFNKRQYYFPKTLYHTIFLEFFLYIGDLGKVLTIIEEFSDYLKSTDSVFLSEFYKNTAEYYLKLTPPNFHEAEENFKNAINIAQEQNAKYLELRVTNAYAKFLIKQKRKEEAKNILSEIYNQFTEGFDVSGLKEARELLEELT